MPTSTSKSPRKPADRKPKSDKPKKPKTEKISSVPLAADTEGEYTPTTWGSGGGLGGLHDLVVPSGQKCLVRRPGVEGLLSAGVLNDIDTLTALVGETVEANSKKGPANRKAAGAPDINKILEDPSKMTAVLHTVDRTICATVVKPPINMTPNDVTSRKGGVIYADMIDLTDKMFIFQYVVGGSADLESFREELDAAVAGLDSGEAVEDPTE